MKALSREPNCGHPWSVTMTSQWHLPSFKDSWGEKHSEQETNERYAYAHLEVSIPPFLVIRH